MPTLPSSVRPHFLAEAQVVFVHTINIDTLLICAYTQPMKVDFDPLKNERNIRERQLSFERMAEVDFNTALVVPDNRKAYGETRYIALCYLDRRLHVLCFTETEMGIRVISFRKANTREVNRYGKPQITD